MANLREKMARHGFESNDDYAYPLRCLLGSATEAVRCLNVDGDPGRRKTAFANALAHALEYPHVLHHDFTQQRPPLPDVILRPTRDEQGREEPPNDPFDQVMSETCALSEGENTVLILDQLQAADFREHIRLMRFLESARWEFRDAVYFANRDHLLLFLISEEPLYHSLQRLSFRVWVSRVSQGVVEYRPEEFGLGPEARPLMQALAQLFASLDTAPTRSAYARILHDVQLHVRTADALRQSIYGWTEGVERERLYARQLDPRVRDVMNQIERFLGVDEVELHARGNE